MNTFVYNKRSIQILNMGIMEIGLIGCILVTVYINLNYWSTFKIILTYKNHMNKMMCEVCRLTLGAIQSNFYQI